MDFRLEDPAHGHDLMWTVATRGQVQPTAVAMALLDYLGEAPSAIAVTGWHPVSEAFEQMVQVAVPVHLGRLMREGPAAAARGSSTTHATQPKEHLVAAHSSRRAALPRQAAR